MKGQSPNHIGLGWMEYMAERNTGRGNGRALLFKLVATAMVLLAILACGEAAQDSEPTPAPPPGMFSALPTTENPHPWRPAACHRAEHAGADAHAQSYLHASADAYATAYGHTYARTHDRVQPAHRARTHRRVQPAHRARTHDRVQPAHRATDPPPRPTSPPRPDPPPQSNQPTASGPTAASNQPTATVPGSPAGLTARAAGETEIGLSWSLPSSDGGAPVTSNRIEVSDIGSNWSVLEANTGSSGTSYTHRGLTGGSTRHYRVSAINLAGVGPPSNTANATTDASATPTPTRTPTVTPTASPHGDTYAHAHSRR